MSALSRWIALPSSSRQAMKRLSSTTCSPCALFPRRLGQSQSFQPCAHPPIRVDTELLLAHIVESARCAKEKTDCVGAKCILCAELRGDPRIAVARDGLAEQWPARICKRHRPAWRITDAIVDIVGVFGLSRPSSANPFITRSAGIEATRSSTRFGLPSGIFPSTVRRTLFLRAISPASAPCTRKHDAGRSADGHAAFDSGCQPLAR